MNGKTPISLDEAVALAEAHKVTLDGIGSAVRMGLNVPTSIKTAPEEYLTLLHRDLSALARVPRARTWSQMDDAPIIWFKMSRPLAAFKIFYWNRVMADPSQAESLYFGQSWMEASDTTALLDSCKASLRLYQSVPGVEVWSRRMFDKTIAQMEDIRDLGGMGQEAFDLLTEELHLMVGKLRHLVRSGLKASDGGGASLQVLENRTFSGGNTFCGLSDEVSYAYFDLGYPDFLRYDDYDVVAQRTDRFAILQPHLTPLSGSERNTFEFFVGLERQVKRLTSTAFLA